MYVYHTSQVLKNVYYRKTSNISRISVGDEIVDNSDVVGASPVGAAPTTSSFSTQHLASMDWVKTTARVYKKHLNSGFGAPFTRGFTVTCNIQYQLSNTKFLHFLWEISEVIGI